MRHDALKRVIQTLSYLPHFISVAVFLGIIILMLHPSTGISNHVLISLGIIKDPIFFLSDPIYFWPILVLSNLMKGLGWGSNMHSCNSRH